MPDDRPITVLCLASEYKGVPFIEECARQGAQVILVTPEKISDREWPWEAITRHFPMPDLYTQPNITYAVSYLAREYDIDRIIALDDYDVGTAAGLREHLRLAGLGETTARYFRDKLAMRTQASAAGIRVPAFTSLFNYDDLRDFMARIPVPWVLKPRFEAGAVGIRKQYDSEQVWRALDELGDQQSFYLLEQFLPGDLFPCRCAGVGRQIVFATVSQYGAPLLALIQSGGIFSTRILARESTVAQELTARTAEMVAAFQLPRGVTHTEFIRAHHDGEFYFLETSARVGGANIDSMVEAATGISLWTEAARIELASIRGGSYEVPDARDGYAGLITCLARDEWPDMSGYTDPEIVWRVPKAYHAGLLVASPEASRVEELLTQYHDRFTADFLIHAPQQKEVRTTL
ncbi:MAG: ATPase [Chloroflexota bacterium]